MGKARPRIPKLVAKRVFLSTGGRCHHCGKKLDRNNRSSWHIDHFPVRYSDIQGQICCGVTDPLDERNLVPSCVPCNLSHRFEKKYWHYCGRSQLPCRRKVWKRVGVFALLLASNVLSAFIAYTTSCNE